MHRCDFTRTFSAAHRVWNDPGKCNNIHGHNYRCHVEVICNTEAMTVQNFTVPFDVVKEHIDVYDHTLILDAHDPLLPQLEALGMALTIVGGVPSTEFLAERIATAILMDAHTRANAMDAWFQVAVTLRETDSIEAYSEVGYPI